MTNNITHIKSRQFADHVINPQAVERLFDPVKLRTKLTNVWAYLDNAKICSERTARDSIFTGKGVRRDIAEKIVEILECDLNDILLNASKKDKAIDMHTGEFTLLNTSSELFPWIDEIPFADPWATVDPEKEIMVPMSDDDEIDWPVMMRFNFCNRTTFMKPATPSSLIEGIKTRKFWMEYWDLDIDGAPQSWDHAIFDNVSEMVFWEGSGPNLKTKPLLNEIFDAARQIQTPMTQGMSFENMLSAISPQEQLQDALIRLEKEHGLTLFIAELRGFLPDLPFPSKRPRMKIASRTVIVIGGAAHKRMKLNYHGYALYGF